MRFTFQHLRNNHMAHFYGVLNGSHGEATRCGTKSSGLTTVAASWAGAVQTCLFVRDGIDYAEVSLREWQGNGTSRVLYCGPVSGQEIVRSIPRS